MCQALEWEMQRTGVTQRVWALPYELSGWVAPKG